MAGYSRQHQLNIDAQCDWLHESSEPAPELDRPVYADSAREWAGMEARRPFVPSNWQEGDTL